MTEDELLLENQKLRDKLAGTLKELEWLRLWNELDRSNAEVAEQELVRLRKIHEKEIVQALQKKSATLMEENKRLLKTVIDDEDVEYWVGITEDPDRSELKSLRWKVGQLEQKIQDLETVIKNKNRSIAFLRKRITDLCYEGEDPFAGTSLEIADPFAKDSAVKRGRPSVSTVGTEIEARRLRKSGLTVREIAERMDWSVGKVQKVTGSVQVDVDARRQHMKNRARSPKKRK